MCYVYLHEEANHETANLSSLVIKAQCTAQM